jgi:hypothetical protein
VSTSPGPMGMSSTARLAVDLGSCMEVAASVELSGTGTSGEVVVAAAVDGQAVAGGLMPSGVGGRLLSIGAQPQRARR